MSALSDLSLQLIHLKHQHIVNEFDTTTGYMTFCIYSNTVHEFEI